MAKITGPLLSFGASGSIGKTIVASKWKGRPYMRQYVVPANPKTVAQLLTRDSFSFARAVWKIGGTILREPWIRFAVGQVLIPENKFQGNFVKENRGEVDLLSWNISPGAKGGLAPLSIVASSPGINNISIAMTNPTPPIDWTLTAAQGFAIRDQDPQSGGLFTTVEAEDLAAAAVLLPGLTTAVLYVCGAWLKWLKADGTVAYSVALMTTFTPTP